MRFYPVLLLTFLLLNVSVSGTTLIGYWALGRSYQRGTLDRTEEYTKHTESSTSSTMTETETNGWSEEITNAHNVEVSAAGTIMGMDLGAAYGYSREETTTRSTERTVENSASAAFTSSETNTKTVSIPAADSTQYPMTNVFFWRTLAIKRTLACCEESHENGIDYYGNDLSDGKKYNVPDACSCQRLCAERGDCNYWTFAPWGDQPKTCWLKWSNGGRKGRSDRVSGAKHCADSCSYSQTSGHDCYNYNRITIEGFRGNDVTVETCQSLCTNHDDCVKINYYFNGICTGCGTPSRCYLISSAANSGCFWSSSSTADTYTKGDCAWREYDYTYAESDDLTHERQQNGCGYEIAPNCVPGYCHEDDVMCWTCTSPEYEIDQSFTPPERCTRCQSHVQIYGSQDWFTCMFKTGVYKCGGYCCCEDGYEPDSNGVCNPCESSATEDESELASVNMNELASVNMKLKETNKALSEALQHLEESQV